MLTLLTLLLPMIVCIVYTVKFLFSKDTHRSRPLLAVMSAVSAIYYFADANYYSVYEDYRTLVVCDILSAYAAPALPALVMLFLRSIVFERYVRWYTYIVLYVIPCTLGAMTLTQYLLMGMEDSAAYIRALDYLHPESEALMEDFGREVSVHFYTNIIAYYAVTGTLCMLTLWQVGYYMHRTRFKFREVTDLLFRHGEMEPLHIEGILFALLFVCFIVRMFVFRSYILDHQWVAVTFSLLLAVLTWMILHVATFVSRPALSLFGHVPLQEASPVMEVVEPVVDDECDCNALAADIRRLMEIEQAYLSPTLSIEDVARTLGTNKSYVSRCINAHMHITFRDYVNCLRVEHAKRMMLSHPDYVQDEIASESGFADASQFNRKFRQVVGVTPRQWVLSQSATA